MENEIDTIEVANLLLMNEIEVIKGESSSELSHVEKYYNIDWQETEGDDRFFKLSLIVEELQPGLYSIAGTVMGDELLVSLETKHYYNDKE